MQYKRQWGSSTGEQLHYVQKKRQKGLVYEEINKNILDGGRFFVSGFWNFGNFTSGSANCAFLYGNCFLLCKKAPGNFMTGLLEQPCTKRIWTALSEKGL